MLLISMYLMYVYRNVTVSSSNLYVITMGIYFVVLIFLAVNLNLKYKQFLPEPKIYIEEIKYIQKNYLHNNKDKIYL